MHSPGMVVSWAQCTHLALGSALLRLVSGHGVGSSIRMSSTRVSWVRVSSVGWRWRRGGGEPAVGVVVEPPAALVDRSVMGAAE